MATSAYRPVSDRPVSLACIDAIITVHLGPARVKGNAQPAAFNRQLAMYLAKNVGRWSTTRIGRFYNGRDHSTVCHVAAQRQNPWRKYCAAERSRTVREPTAEIRD